MFTLIPFGVLLMIIYLFLSTAQSRWILLPAGILITLGAIFQLFIFIDILEYAWVGIPIALLAGYLLLRCSGEKNRITNRIFFIIISVSSVVVLLILLQLIVSNIAVYVIGFLFLSIGSYILLFNR